MKLVIDFEGDGKQSKKQSKKQTSGFKLGDANWQTAIITGVMVAGIVVPQFSLLLKSVFSIQDTTLPPAITNTSGAIKYRLPVAHSVPTTSGYGWRIHPITGQRRFHAGLDFGAAYGQSIYAAAGGVVTFAGNKGGYGNTVEVKHNQRESTLYGHASRILVSVGQRVTQGQVIAEVGSTGMSTGPHLHFEVHVGGQHTDPRPFLSSQLAGR